MLRLGSRTSRRFALALIVGLVLLTALMLSAAGFDVVHAIEALAAGAVGSPDAVMSSTLVRATPLILTGLAVAVAFQAGVFNIGAEGQFLVGAAASTALALLLRNLWSPAAPGSPPSFARAFTCSR